MIVMCENCGKKYKVDPNKVDSFPASFNCLNCENSITINNPDQMAFDGLDVHSASTPTVSDKKISATQAAQRSGSMYDSNRSAASTTEQGSQTMASLKSSRVKMSLVTKVVFIMLMVSLIPVLIYWAYSFKTNMDRLRQNTEALSAQVTDGLVGQVDEWIDKNVRVLKAVVKLDSITSMDPKQQEPVLKAIAEEYSWMYLVFTTDTTGMNLSRSDGKSLRDYSDRSYYKNVMSGNELSWQTLIGKTSKKPANVACVVSASKDSRSSATH